MTITEHQIELDLISKFGDFKYTYRTDICDRVQEDLLQEKEDNQQDPEGKKAALTRIIADYNARFGTNHRISGGDLYRQDFDGEHLWELMAPLNLGWKARTQKKLALMEELMPLLDKLVQGQEIAGLAAYEEGR